MGESQTQTRTSGHTEVPRGAYPYFYDLFIDCRDIHWGLLGSVEGDSWCSKHNPLSGWSASPNQRMEMGRDTALLETGRLAFSPSGNLDHSFLFSSHLLDP